MAFGTTSGTVTLVSFSVTDDGTTPAAEAPVVPVVRTVTIGDTASKETAVYPGEVRGKFESNLAFQVLGKIRARHINLGDKVRAGQVLMELDPKDVQQSYNAAQATYQAALSNYEVVKENYKRYTALYEKGAVSTMIRDEHKTRYDAAASQLESARAQLTASGNQMDYTRLVSDHDGVVASISGEVGQVVGAGTPVATVVQDGSREIQIFVPENRLGQIRLNQPATITFWALNNLTATGHIAEIAPGERFECEVGRHGAVLLRVWPGVTRDRLTGKLARELRKESVPEPNYEKHGHG